MAAPISGYGVIAAGAALLTILASAILSFGGSACPVPLLIALYVAGAAEIILLCRTTVPGWMQGMLILFLIASLTTLAARTDVRAVRRTEGARADASTPRAAAPAVRKAVSGGNAGGEGAASGGTGAQGGAKLFLAAARTGDGGWATLLNTAYDRRLGGPHAAKLLISGNVDAKRVGKDSSVQVVWRISSDGFSVSCGSTSVYGSDYPALSDEFRRSFGQALSRSIELRRVSCQ